MDSGNGSAKDKENLHTSAAMTSGEEKAPAIGHGKDWQKRAEMLQQQLRLAREKTEKRKPRPCAGLSPTFVGSKTCPNPTSTLGAIGNVPSVTSHPADSSKTTPMTTTVPLVSSAAARSSATTERMLQMVHTLRQKIKTGAPLRESRRLKEATAPAIAANSNDGNNNDSAVRADTRAPYNDVAQHPVVPGARIGFARGGARSRLISMGGASAQDHASESLLSAHGNTGGQTAVPSSVTCPSVMETGSAQPSPFQPHISARLRNPHAPPALANGAGSVSEEEEELPSTKTCALGKKNNSTITPTTTFDTPASAAPMAVNFERTPLDLNHEEPEPYQEASSLPQANSTAVAVAEKVKVETMFPCRDSSSPPQDELTDRGHCVIDSALSCNSESTETPSATKCCASSIFAKVEATCAREGDTLVESTPDESVDNQLFEPVSSPGSADHDGRLVRNDHANCSITDKAGLSEKSAKDEFETSGETTSAAPTADNVEVETDIFDSAQLDAFMSEEAAAIVASTVADESGPAWRIPMAPQVVVHGFQGDTQDSVSRSTASMEVVRPDFEGGDTSSQHIRAGKSSVEAVTPPTVESLTTSAGEAEKSIPDAKTENDAPMKESKMNDKSVDCKQETTHNRASPVVMEAQVTHPVMPEVLAKESVGEQDDAQSYSCMAGECGTQGSSIDITRASSPQRGLVGEHDARQVANSDEESSLAKSHLCPQQISASVQVSSDKVPLNPETPETALRTECALRSSAEECIASIDATDDVLLFNADSPFPMAPEIPFGAAECCQGSPVVLDTAVAEEVASMFLLEGERVADGSCQDSLRQMEQDSCNPNCHSTTPDVEFHGIDSRSQVGVSLSLKLGWSSSIAQQPQTIESNPISGISSSPGLSSTSPPSPVSTALPEAPEARKRVMFDINASPASCDEDDLLEEGDGIAVGRMPQMATSKLAPCVEVVNRTAQDDSGVEVRTTVSDHQHLVPLEAVVSPEVVARVMQEEPLGQLENYFKHEGVVLYTTSMRTIRQTYDNCEKIRALFQILGVDYEDRDVSMSTEWRDELESRLGGRQMLPRVFVNGKYLGGHKEVEHLAETYTLQDMLKKAGYELGQGGGIGGMGRQKVEWVICFCCNGSKKIEDEDGYVIPCVECNENGLMPWTQEDEERYASL